MSLKKKLQFYALNSVYLHSGVTQCRYDTLQWACQTGWTWNITGNSVYLEETMKSS